MSKVKNLYCIPRDCPEGEQVLKFGKRRGMNVGDEEIVWSYNRRSVRNTLREAVRDYMTEGYKLETMTDCSARLVKDKNA